MNLEEIKSEATKSEFKDLKSLSDKIIELKAQGISFLGCVAFVQANKNISLKNAQKLTLALEAYNKGEKKKNDGMIKLMFSEFKEE
ncbi:hypothetical protein [Thalassobellus citreus]|uniref:hypothetical protein n=1 Tax=Thalassobellus citreus TaxID=3367752 RepID=UPI0037AD7E18